MIPVNVKFKYSGGAGGSYPASLVNVVFEGEWKAVIWEYEMGTIRVVPATDLENWEKPA